ncbi:hypothetical protein GYMLUDRAFT_65022 [Collybiopsis luxurians FD-317 M1]|uniref:Uncharacterized protein n=1 Tax=Collybiopsis luxurians FD-317 M1 TaxID=944289 RepID=A0A0D0ALK3_9AGAR|nr:hypothetical protein GYMLUDRAFT_65022 [Collybiopsis luxurians FD-317 M1]
MAPTRTTRQRGPTTAIILPTPAIPHYPPIHMNVPYPQQANITNTLSSKMSSTLNSSVTERTQKQNWNCLYHFLSYCDLNGLTPKDIQPPSEVTLCNYIAANFTAHISVKTA